MTVAKQMTVQMAVQGVKQQLAANPKFMKHGAEWLASSHFVWTVTAKTLELNMSVNAIVEETLRSNGCL